MEADLKAHIKKLKAANLEMQAALRDAKADLMYFVGNDCERQYSRSPIMIRIRAAIKAGKDAMKP